MFSLIISIREPGFLVVFVQKLTNKVAHKLAMLPCLVNCYNLVMYPLNMLSNTITYDVLS